jgi:Skp family chaperone for outer membrane proteins
MGMNKLLNKLSDMLNPAIKKRKKYHKNLKAILKKLKARENELKDKLESTNDDRKRNRLQKELDLIHKQRKKGVEAMRGEAGNNSDDKQKSE